MARTSRTKPVRKRNSGSGRANGNPGTDTASRRDHIIALAAELFAEKGVAVTTVRDIGDAAGILSGSLYYHFDSKEAIAEEIVTRYLDELIQSYTEVSKQEEDPRARIEGLIRASFEAIDEHRHACEIFQNDYKYLRSLPRLANIDTLTSKVQRHWTDTIKAGVAAGVFRDDVDPKLFYCFARDAIWFAVRWYRPGGRDSVDKLSSSCTTILLDGFTPR